MSDKGMERILKSYGLKHTGDEFITLYFFFGGKDTMTGSPPEIESCFDPKKARPQGLGRLHSRCPHHHRHHAPCADGKLTVQQCHHKGPDGSRMGSHTHVGIS